MTVLQRARFEVDDLLFYMGIAQQHAGQIPFVNLLGRNNESHRKGLDVGEDI